MTNYNAVLVCTSLEESRHYCFHTKGSSAVLQNTVVGNVHIHVSKTGRVFTVHLPSKTSMSEEYIRHFTKDYDFDGTCIRLTSCFPGWHHAALYMLIEDLYTLRQCTMCHVLSRGGGSVARMCDTCLRNRSAHIIQAAFKRSITDPSYTLCRNRLMREFHDLACCSS